LWNCPIAYHFQGDKDRKHDHLVSDLDVYTVIEAYDAANLDESSERNWRPDCL
jgi:hypothetical protein